MKMLSVIEQLHEIVPDVEDEFRPKLELRIIYPSDEVYPGDEFSPEETEYEPKIEFWGDPGVLYTLLMVDPDAPSRQDPKYSEWRHWIVANIPGSDPSEGDALSKYVGPSPPKGSGYHRYIFLLYEQPGRIMDFFDDNMRKRFNTRSFVEKHDLGYPVAANFFLARE